MRVCSFDDVTGLFEAGEFDVVVLNGPTEHFVSEADASAGRDEAVRRTLFDALQVLIKPGGRVFITCIHFRWPTDITEVRKSPLAHPVGSYYFYCSVLVEIYSGWYPLGDVYDRLAADAGFDLVRERDATNDYYLTSRMWSTRLKDYLRTNPRFARQFVTGMFRKDPRYFFSVFLFWLYDPWTWQFRPTDVAETPLTHR